MKEVRKLEIQLKYLGLNYQFETEVEIDKSVSPEDVIINVCNFSEFRDNKKYFANLLLWLKFYSSLVYIDGLSKKLDRLSPQGTVLLLSIAKRNLKKDPRWKKIVKSCEQNLQNDLEIDSKSFVNRKGEDPYLIKYEVSIANVEMSDDKKISIRPKVLLNPWLKNRLLF